MALPEFLEISLHGKTVGTLVNQPNDSNLFEFDPEYVQDETRPTLSLSFLDESGDFVETVRRARRLVPPFFSNLLPEGELRRSIAARDKVSENRDFPLLAIVGEDLPGAVVATPLETSRSRITSHEETTEHGSELVHDGAIADDSLRFSLAGVQLKYSAVANAAGGLTIPAHGTGGDWIVKLPSMVYPHVPENEFSMLSFARAVGIEVPEIALIDIGAVRNLPQKPQLMSGLALQIRRFDRGPNGARIHIEDFNQVFGQFPHDKYKNRTFSDIARVLYRTAGQSALEAFIERLIFNAGIGNGDMHLKNWSLIYRDTIHPELSPAYDFLNTTIYINGDRMALSFGGSKDWDILNEDRIAAFVKRADISLRTVTRTAHSMAARMQEIWPKIQADLPLETIFKKEIDTQLKRALPPPS